MEKKFRRIDEKTRLLISNFLKWTGVCSLVISMTLMVLLLDEAYIHSPNQYSMDRVLFASFTLTALLSMILVNAARFLMNPYDWAIYYLQKFLQEKTPDDLEKAFRNYNRILGSSLSLKKLLAISQYINEGYKIGKKNESKNLDKVIGSIIKSLERGRLSQANDRLLALSNSAMELIREHKEILGFEVKYPLRLRISEQIRGLLSKIFPQLMLFLVWLMLVVFLASLGLVPITPPT